MVTADSRSRPRRFVSRRLIGTDPGLSHLHRWLVLADETEHIPERSVVDTALGNGEAAVARKVFRSSPNPAPSKLTTPGTPARRCWTEIRWRKGKELKSRRTRRQFRRTRQELLASDRISFRFEGRRLIPFWNSSFDFFCGLRGGCYTGPVGSQRPCREIE